MSKALWCKTYLFLICWLLLSISPVYGYFNYTTQVTLITCKALSKDGQPAHITSEFAFEDKYVHVWFELEYVCQPIRIKFEYYDPEGNLNTTTTSEWTSFLKPYQCIKGYKIWDQCDLSNKKRGEWLCKVSIEYETGERKSGFYPLGKCLFTLSKALPKTKSLTLILREAMTGAPINGVIAHLSYPDRFIEFPEQEAIEGVIALRELPIGEISLLLQKENFKSERLTFTLQEDEYTFDIFMVRKDDFDRDGFAMKEDCDDNDPEVNPGMEEILCNKKDDDCNPDTPDSLFADSCETPVHFEDPRLEWAIREAVNIGEDVPITEKMALAITFLKASYREITNLAGLQHLKNLRELDLSGNNIRDLKPITELENLTFLALSNNNLIDINILVLLTPRLEVVLLNDNKIFNIAPLGKLINLKELHLQSNKISDIHSLIGPIDSTTGSAQWIDKALKVLHIENNNLDREDCPHIKMLIDKGVKVNHDLECFSAQREDISEIINIRQ
ncbi:MAG: leucine-rich repeat domain-containing protein [bacterium]